MIKRVSELTSEPEIGKFYLVPCVKTSDGMPWPVIGPEHEDKEHVNFPWQHRHYDLRFFNDRQIRYTNANNYKTLRDQGVQYALLMVALADRTVGPLVELRRKCRRQMLEFPIAHPTWNVGPKWFPALEAAYRGSKLSPCLRCPHRGLPLNSLPVKDGKVICPGHGLQWDVETDELVSRLSS